MGQWVAQVTSISDKPQTFQVDQKLARNNPKTRIIINILEALLAHHFHSKTFPPTNIVFDKTKLLVFVSLSKSI